MPNKKFLSIKNIFGFGIYKIQNKRLRFLRMKPFVLDFSAFAFLITHLTQRGELDLVLGEFEKLIVMLSDTVLTSKQNDSAGS